MTKFTAEFIEEQRKIIRNGTMTALQMKGNNEIDLHINRMYRRAKQEHCEKYYPEALDHIEHLQARVQELEQDLSDQSQKRLENAQVSTDRIIALEGKIRELEQERDYLDARLAQFEKLARKFVKCKYPDYIIRLQFQALLNEEDSCSG